MAFSFSFKIDTHVPLIKITVSERKGVSPAAQLSLDINQPYLLVTIYLDRTEVVVNARDHKGLLPMHWNSLFTLLQELGMPYLDLSSFGERDKTRFSDKLDIRVVAVKEYHLIAYEPPKPKQG